MQKLTAVTPATTQLPPALRLLLAPVRIAGIVSGREHAGRTEGVILDGVGRVVAFVVRIAPDLAPGGPRTLVPVTAMTPTATGGVELSWSEDKLLEHPKLDESATGDAVSDHGGGDVDPKETSAGVVAGTAIGAGFGAIAAFALAPLGVLAAAAFFAAGGALVGAAAGAAQDAPPTRDDDELEAHNAAFLALESALRDPALETSKIVRVMPFEAGDVPAAASSSAATAPRGDLREGMRVTSADRVDLGRIVQLDGRAFRVEKGHMLPQDLDVPYDDVASVRGDQVLLRRRRHDYVEAPNGEPMITEDELGEVARGELSPRRLEQTEQKL